MRLQRWMAAVLATLATGAWAQAQDRSCAEFYARLPNVSWALCQGAELRTSEGRSVRGRPIAIELLPDGYRFAALDADDNWRPLIDPPVFTDRTLPPGLAWAGLRLEGQPDGASRRLQFGTQPPEYELRVTTPGGEARFTGRANGEVVLSLAGAAAR